MLLDHNITHLAFIMDGNRRWGDHHRKTHPASYQAGAAVVKELIPVITKLGIKYSSFFTLSTDNLQRSSEIIDSIVDLINFYLENEIELFRKHNIAIKFIGNLDNLDARTKKNIDNISNIKHQSIATQIIIAFNYGGQEEIIRACNNLLAKDIKNISVQEFAKYLFYPEMPPVDLLIRTGGHNRLSNFLLWQSAYSELYFLDKLWPDFTQDDLMQAIIDFKKRVRKFGH